MAHATASARSPQTHLSTVRTCWQSLRGMPDIRHVSVVYREGDEKAISEKLLFSSLLENWTWTFQSWLCHWCTPPLRLKPIDLTSLQCPNDDRVHAARKARSVWAPCIVEAIKAFAGKFEVQLSLEELNFNYCRVDPSTHATPSALTRWHHFFTVCKYWQSARGMQDTKALRAVCEVVAKVNIGKNEVQLVQSWPCLSAQATTPARTSLRTPLDYRTPVPYSYSQYWECNQSIILKRCIDDMHRNKSDTSTHL